VIGMLLKMISILGLLIMIATLAGLYAIGGLFSFQPITIALQVIAVALMAWARVTFGRRSFHAAAEPTAGGLVTTGPYRYIRHPIYTAICLFCLGGIVTHWSWQSATLGLLLFLGSLTRIFCEERLLKQSYPEYLQYSKTTKRMIPYVF
jgi:protein-S-isoprenylcysteine O-methyltransferase Ste14